jgi:hypothetical protein
VSKDFLTKVVICRNPSLLSGVYCPFSSDVSRIYFDKLHWLNIQRINMYAPQLFCRRLRPGEYTGLCFRPPLSAFLSFGLDRGACWEAILFMTLSRMISSRKDSPEQSEKSDLLPFCGVVKVGHDEG